MNPEHDCPKTCPNRKPEPGNDGITFKFGHGLTVHLDPFEILCWFLLALPIGVTLRDAPGLEFEEAVKRMGIVAGLAIGIRKAPTEKIYQLLADKKLG